MADVTPRNAAVPAGAGGTRADGEVRRPAHPIPARKRALDLGLALPALIILPAVAAVTTVAMWMTGDRGPLLYGGWRVGEGGRLFRAYKFRSMRPSASGPRLTADGDPRITPVGSWLRRTKIDELPQLLNVVRGDMSLVGPRPEDPRYVDWHNPLHAEVFSCRPGITGPAQIRFRHEERMLRQEDAERQYIEQVLPAKLALDASYLRSQSIRDDLRLLAQTVRAITARGDHDD